MENCCWCCCAGLLLSVDVFILFSIIQRLKVFVNFRPHFPKALRLFLFYRAQREKLVQKFNFTSWQSKCKNNNNKLYLLLYFTIKCCRWKIRKLKEKRRKKSYLIFCCSTFYAVNNIILCTVIKLLLCFHDEENTAITMFQPNTTTNLHPSTSTLTCPSHHQQQVIKQAQKKYNE